MSDNIELNTFINSLSVDSYHQNLLYYMLSGGKYYRKSIFDQLDPTRQYQDLGWAIEILHAYLLITDDIIDNSDMRRGKAAWHIMYPNNALKDALFLHSLIFQIVSYHKDHVNYVQILHTFQLTASKTWIGQCQDSLKKDIKTEDDINQYYNFAYYTEQLIAKTCYYTLILPIKVGCLVHSMEYKDYYDELCMDISFILQFQDDYLNYYPGKSGKSGTDLKEKKVTWFLCKLMSDPSNREIMHDYLVNNNFDDVMLKIHPLLDSYQNYETELYDKCVVKIQDEDYVFRYIMRLIYQREK